MPIGGKPGGAGIGPGRGPALDAIGPRTSPHYLGDADQREHWLTEIGGPDDLWIPWTVKAADLIAATAGTGPAGTADVNLVAGKATRLTILERNGSAVLVGFNRAPFTSPGGYDLLHPGNAMLDFGIPPTQVFSFRLEAGATAPTKHLELWFRGGIHTLRPV